MLCKIPTGETFEVPDAWMREVGQDLVRRTDFAYRHGSSSLGFDVRVVHLSQVRPPVREAGVVALDPERARSILRGFAAGDAVEPVEVVDLTDGAFRYRVRNGFHRYHLSIAWGFSHLPVALNPWAEDWM
jgi:hypothetical protein